MLEHGNGSRVSLKMKADFFFFFLWLSSRTELAKPGLVGQLLGRLRQEDLKLEACLSTETIASKVYANY